MVNADGGPSLQATAAERFDNSVRTNPHWIYMFIDEGFTLKGQNAILSGPAAPLKVTQLRRNVAKYTTFIPIQ